MKKGQTLVVLLVFIAIAITVAIVSVALIVSNTDSASKFELGTVTFQAAEAGAELALLKLLRDPNYPGETFSLGSASVTVNVSGSSLKTVTAQSSMGSIIRKDQVIVDYPQSGSMTISSWKEVF